MPNPARRSAPRPLAPIALAVLCCCWLPAFAASRAQAADILQPKLLSSRSFSESYTVIADLEGGAYLQLQIAVSNLGLRSGNAGCRVLWLEPEKGPITRSSRVPRGDWAHHPGPPARLETGACRLQGGERTEFVADQGGVRIRLELDERIRPTRPLGGRTAIGDKFYESDILVPWAEARVEVDDGSGEIRSFRGHGYADHSRSTTLPRELADRWVRFRGLQKNGSLLALLRFPSDGSAAEGWVWRQGDPAPVAVRELSTSRTASLNAAWVVRFESASGEIYRVTTERELYRFAPLEEAGFLAKLLGGMVGNPVTYTYRAHCTEEIDSFTSAPDGASFPNALPGIAEVTIVSE